MLALMDGQEVAGGDEAHCLTGLRKAIRQQGRVPQRLVIDGQDYALDALNVLDGCGAERVEIETLGMMQAAMKGYGEAAEFLPKVVQVLERSSDRLSLGEVAEAMDDFGRVCQGVAWFFDLVEALDKLAGVKIGWQKDGEELKTLLLQTEEAIEQQDWVLVADQLRYEWAPRLHAWAARLPQAQADATALLTPRL